MQITTWDKTTESDRAQLLDRPATTNREVIQNSTRSIINTVKENGDRALYDLTKKYDQADLNNLMVTQNEVESALNKIDQETSDAIELAISRITNYHNKFIPQTVTVDTRDGIICERVSRPIQRVGLYVPGGTAPLISTLMMITIPANIANCPIKILTTPPNPNGKIDPALLFAAQRCGIDKIFKIGGAQAIAAMAYGTESVPKVNKIYGPGNAWVTEAKMAVSQDPDGASIDLPAGPSEVMVIADKYSNPIFVASDLLSQAEHGVDSQVLLVTDDKKLAQKVLAEIEIQVDKLSRKEIAAESLKKSPIIVVNKLEEAFDICNQYAPEHLILQLDNPRQYLPQIQSAGAIFLGSWTPETLGDYLSGSNHVLPTYGYAKSYSGLSVADYMISMSVQEASYEGLKKIGEAAMKLAAIEGLDAHRSAVSLRLKSEGKSR